MSVEVALDAPYGRYYKDNQAAAEKWMLYLMDGAVPQTPAEVKARVDINSHSDMFNKAVATAGTVMSASSCIRDVGSTIMSIKGVAQGVGMDTTYYKGGSYVSTTTFVMPRKIFRPDGKTSMLALNRSLIATSLYGLGHNVSDMYSGVTQLRSSASDPAATDIQFEYDTPIYVNSVYWMGGGAAATVLTTLAILYYDDASSSWKTAQTFTLTAANNSSGGTFTITTPFTASKIIARITCTNTAAFKINVAFSGPPANNPPASIGNVVVPTWGIFIPDYVVNYSSLSASINWLQSKANGITNNIPAIIDSAGYNDGSRIELNADYSFKRYTFALGGIKS